MASDTRFRRKLTDEVDANSLKKIITNGKDSSGLRRFKLAGETLLTRHNTLSPDIGNENLSSSYSVSKQSAKTLSVPEWRRKKEKSVIQVPMESRKVEIPLESVGIKRKKMTARAFRALFKRQRLGLDVAVELEGSDKLSHSCSGNNREIGSEPMGKREDVSDESSRRVVAELRDGSVDRASDGPLQKLTDSFHDANILGNEISVDPNLMENVVDEPSRVSSDFRGTLDDSERLATHHSPTKNKDALESECLTRPRKSQRDAINSESGEKCMHPKVAETIPLSAKRAIRSLTGTCTLCSKEKRISYNSADMELCSCDCTVEKELDSSYTCKDKGDHGAAEKWDQRNPLNKRHSNCQMDGDQNVCAVCNKHGELLRCEGKNCKRCYHFCCLGSPVADVLPGIWYCPDCAIKKLQYGVHSVSEGAESIWGVREEKVSNDKGTRQKQYLVKYHGLAHIHNLWVPEKLLLLENPSLFYAKDQIRRWSVEWTIPHRLLRKRSILDKSHAASSSDTSESNYEWLVKWHGLDYDHASWELGNSYFLSSSVGRNLMKDYEIRRQKAKKEIDKCPKGSFELSKLPASGKSVNDNVLKNVNKLRECWYKRQNAVVFDNQEREMTVAFFIQSMAEICQSFLIVATSDSFSQWEAELARLAPSVDVVVYSGNIDTRKGIRASEFYEEGGRVMLQVLLSSPTVVLEDIDMLSCIRWQSVIFDEYQHSGISIDLEQMKMLTTDLRILIIGGQINDTTTEYLNILSLLESDADFNKLRGLKSETNDNLSKLKERLSRFIAYGSTFEVSKFVEYWVPVEISYCQLEQYCATLISNSIPLCSCSRTDEVGALRDTIPTLRKCCDHPYLVDSSMQERVFVERRLATEILDIGIKASGKLRLLDEMLTEVKTRGLQVLILFQLVLGSGGVSSGDILDDFLRHRFGENAYERVHAGLTLSRKQAALNRFNKENGKFVLMLENRACTSTIKLSSLDIIVIYDSDWNPENDLRALQKISIDSTVDHQIKVFRLYSSYTVEERALVLAKQNLNLNNNLQTSSRAISDSLLMWGATRLFRKLDNYHAETSPDIDIIYGKSLLNEVTKEFNLILSESRDDNDPNLAISKAKLNVVSYSTNTPMLGEAKIQFRDGEEPHMFWRNLLDGRSPKWKHLRGQSPRNRKRVQYLDGSPSKSNTKNDDVGKKHKTAVIENVGPASVQVELEKQVTEAAGSKEGLSRSIPHNQSPLSEREGVTLNNNPDDKSGRSSPSAEVEKCGSEERKSLADEQKSYHNSLQGCWIAASISKQKLDKKESLVQTKHLLNYQCTEEQVHAVYSKMRLLKPIYLQCSENTIDSVREEDISKDTSDVNEGGSQFPTSKLHNVSVKVGENFSNEEHCAGSEIDNEIKEVKKRCDKRMKKLIRKQREEIKEFYRIWEEKRLKLENDHEVEMAIVRSIHSQCSKRLKILDDNFAKKMEEHNLLKDLQLKELEAKQIAARDMERQKAAHWLDEAKACCSSELRAVGGARSLQSQSEDDAGCSEPSTHAEDQNRSKSVFSQANDVGQTDTSLNVEERACDEIRSVELDKEIPEEAIDIVPNESVDFVCPVELGNASDKEDEIGSTDTLVNRRDGTDEGAPGSLPLTGQILGPSVASPDPCVFSSQQVPQHEIQQIAGRNVEREKVAHWPTEAKACCSSEVRTLDGARSVPSQSEGEAGCSEMSTHIEDQNPSKSVFVQANDVAWPDTSLSVEERVYNEIRLVELDKEVPEGVLEIVPNENVDFVCPVELSNASDKGDETGSTDTLVNQRDGTDEASAGSLPLTGQILEPLVASPDLGVFSPQQRDTSVNGGERVCDEIRSVELEKETPQEVIKTLPNENVDFVHPYELSNASDEGDVIGSTDTLVNQRDGTDEAAAGSLSLMGQMLEPSVASLDLSVFSPQQMPQDEIQQSVENQSTSRSEVPAPEPIDTLTTFQLSPEFQSALQTEMTTSEHVDTVTAVGPSMELEGRDSPVIEDQGASHDTMATSQTVTAELPNQAPLQLGIDPTHQAAWNSCFFLEPLTNELEKICKEAEQLRKSHEDMVSKLKSDWENEVAQIRNKYETKLQDAKAEFGSKKIELDKNQNKVLLNRTLSEYFKIACYDAMSSELPEVQLGIPPSFMHQQSLQHSIRLHLGASASQPAPWRGPQIVPPTVEVLQQQSPPHSTGFCNVSNQNVVAPPVQAVQHAADLFSGAPFIPPIISATSRAGSLVGEDIRSAAPHLQSIRSISVSSPHQLLPPALPLPSTSQNRPEPLPALLNPSESALGLLVDMDDRPRLPSNHISSALPEIYPSFGSSGISHLETIGNLQGNMNSSAVGIDVVCLSDVEQHLEAL
ncbi:hypothetical protein BUALT_Bualt02G0043600 [Buddleja alternifolia]|uniref:Helicase protein MOM1 n=1 Tax=Buddleja alternifolia TaxID=168488 RepID=A0AAV6Y5C3_9LAMI|nr:hypothetical protein BUALT_Bualt02G0043600 [Buddleja alternifolia]